MTTSAREMPTGRRGAIVRAGAVLAAGLVLAACGAFAAKAWAVTGVEVWLAVTLLPSDLGLPLLLDWDSALSLAALVAVGAVWAGLVRLGVGRGLRPAVLHGALAVALLAALGARGLLWNAALSEIPPRPLNRFGLSTSYPASHEVLQRAPQPSMPDAHIVTNAEGFRDRPRDYAPSTTARRVLVAGDSFVYGSGIATAADLFTTCLEEALAERPPSGDGRPWEAFNLAQSPAALWYYTTALVTVGKAVRPDAYVMIYLRMDLEPYELRRVLAELPPPAARLLHLFGVDDRLMRLNSRLGGKAVDERSGRLRLDGAPLVRHRVALARLVAHVKAAGRPLVVWQYYGTDALFEAFRDDPSVTLLGWEDLPEAPAAAHTWSLDPTLSYPDDGHPTPRTNRLVASFLAERIRRLADAPRAGNSGGDGP